MEENTKVSEIVTNALDQPFIPFVNIPEKNGVKLGKLLKISKNGSHGWFESNVGVIRKPF